MADVTAFNVPLSLHTWRQDLTEELVSPEANETRINKFVTCSQTGFMCNVPGPGRHQPETPLKSSSDTKQNLIAWVTTV